MALDREPGQDGPPIHDLLARRWSPRVYDPAHVLAADELRTILEAARWAPSAGNSQPWAFVTGFRGDATHTTFVPLLSRGNAFWAPRASALLLTAHQVASEPGSELAFSDYAAHDLGQASAHLTVQAQSMGLHVHQFAGFDHDAAAAAFAVPSHWQVTTGIAIGRLAAPESIEADEPSLADRERRLRARKPLSEMVFAGAFGTPAKLDVA